MSGNDVPSTQLVAQNRKARHEYFIEEELEAGIVLKGTEVKSIREGKANIADAYAGEMGGEIWLFNAYIAEYSGGNRFNHDPKRPRKLLLRGKQIKKLLGRLKTRGTTLIPLTMYVTPKGLIKLSIGLATGKKQYEKRDSIKEREWQRDKQRLLKSR